MHMISEVCLQITLDNSIANHCMRRSQAWNLCPLIFTSRNHNPIDNPLSEDDHFWGLQVICLRLNMR